MLDAIAAALHLDDAERDTLYALASRGGAAGTRRIRPALAGLVAEITVPALVLGRRLDVLSWNVAAALLVDFAGVPPHERNLLRLLFLDPRMRALHRDWGQVARETVACLRRGQDRQAHDVGLARLVGELSVKCDTFRMWWAQTCIPVRWYGIRRLDHPVAGHLVLNYEALHLPGDAQVLTVYSADPGSPSAEALRRLLPGACRS